MNSHSGAGKKAIMITLIMGLITGAPSFGNELITSKAEETIYPAQAQIQTEPEVVQIQTEETSEQETEQQTVQQTSQFQETTEQPEEETKKVEPEYRHYAIMDGDTGYTMPIEHQDFVWQMCSEYGIKEYYTLMLALSYHESRYNPNAVSSTHDYGYMQINKCNHGWLKKTLGVKDFLNPYDNIRSGVYMYASLVHKFNPEKALVGYNAGENYARKHSSTKYSRAVLEAQKKLIPLD